ncbi:MAG: Organic radical activating enzyme [Rickettsiaceae bacterium]|jgi:organic radical activating enzyme|nr:Organic radical activating enzyme [Rickettsiaceae bacterium]
MFGNNPIRPPEKGDGSILQVQNIFATFQGEGPYTGWPAVFIRLGGCNLACSFCDTEFESFEAMSVDKIISKINELSFKSKEKLIVITGGEPFRQPIELLCDELIKNNYKIQIETNGTLFRSLNEEVDIICSPKNTGTGYHMIREDLLKRVNAFKFIISAHNDLYKNVGNVGQKQYNTPVYVQPMDERDEEKNRKNTDLVIKLATENGYRISLQTHKILGVE